MLSNSDEMNEMHFETNMGKKDSCLSAEHNVSIHWHSVNFNLFCIAGPRTYPPNPTREKVP